MDARVNGTASGRVAEYLDRVTARDVRGARGLLLSEVSARGDGLVEAIDELLVPAMAEVGARWYDGRWSAAQEHVASGITDSALTVASVRARRRRPPPDAPHVVVACPRGEAHVLPARFAGELLAAAGVDVITLGASVPEQDLAAFLAEAAPGALVLSCTEPLALPGVRDATKAAHAVGIPVLAGGAGLGPDDRRARAVGADGWAGRPAEAVPLLWRWREEPPAFAAPAAEDREVAALRRLRDFFFDDVLTALVHRHPAVRDYGERAMDQARGDIRLVVAALSCALLATDDRLFTDYVTWSRGLLTRRGIGDDVLAESLAVFDDALGPGFPGAHRLLAAAVADW